MTKSARNNQLLFGQRLPYSFRRARVAFRYRQETAEQDLAVIHKYECSPSKGVWEKLIEPGDTRQVSWSILLPRYTETSL